MDRSAGEASTSPRRRSPRSRRSARASRTSASPGSGGVGRLGARSLRELAERHGISPKAALGQHFLIDPNLADAIAAASGAAPGVSVVEIGAGLGSLTRALAERRASVLALEFDRALIPALTEAVGDLPDVAIRQADATSLAWQSLLGNASWRCAANLPYNVGVPILLRALEEAPAIEEYVVMVQREVAERLVAGPGDDSYGTTSLRVAYRADAEILRTVPPSVFWPRPHVGSAVVRLKPHPPRVATDPGVLFRVIDVSFAERRKTMRSAARRLAVPADRVADTLRSAEIDPDARAESLSLDRFAALAEALE
ncbi:MAG: 16S rRNA (adenine(1518)-N(6)/adenine(1519)-N(6))-dimethyltransferase RsmA [Actinomycetota bacterium]